MSGRVVESECVIVRDGGIEGEWADRQISQLIIGKWKVMSSQ